MKKNVLERLDALQPKLSEAQKSIAVYILKNAVEASFLTLDQLSRLVGKSPTTILRLTGNLGFRGYTDFQRELQELLRNRVAPGTRLQANLKDLGRNSLIVKCAEKQVENIHATLNSLSDDDANASAEMILAAKRIYMLGVRTTFTAAYYLYQGLNRILDNCELLEIDSGAQFERILNISSDDLVIAFSFPRYARITTEQVKHIRDRAGAKIILVTDGFSCPLTTVADITLPCGCASLAYHNSMAGAILVSDFLITAVTLKDPIRTRERLEESDIFMKSIRYHV